MFDWCLAELVEQGGDPAFQHLRDAVRHAPQRRLPDIRTPCKRTERDPVAEMIDEHLGDEVVREREIRHDARDLGLVIAFADRAPGPVDRVLPRDASCRHRMNHRAGADLEVRKLRVSDRTDGIREINPLVRRGNVLASAPDMPLGPAADPPARLFRRILLDRNQGRGRGAAEQPRLRGIVLAAALPCLEFLVLDLEPRDLPVLGKQHLPEPVDLTGQVGVLVAAVKVRTFHGRDLNPVREAFR